MQFLKTVALSSKQLLRNRNVFTAPKTLENLRKISTSTNFLSKVKYQQDLKNSSTLILNNSTATTISKFNQSLLFKNNFQRRNITQFFRRKKPEETEQPPPGEQPQGDKSDSYQKASDDTEQPKKRRWRWTIFAIHRVPPGTENERFGTWSAVKEPITSWARIRSVVGGTIFFMALIEVVGVYMEFNIGNMLNTFDSVKDMEEEGDTPFRKEYLYYLSFLPWFAAVMPVTFDRSKFFPMLLDMLNSPDPELQWFAIRGFSSATASEDLRPWAMKIPIDRVIQIVERTLIEGASKLGKYQRPFKPKQQKDEIPTNKTPESLMSQILEVEAVNSKLDELKTIQGLREEQIKKIEDAIFLISSLGQYSSTIPTLMEGGAVEFLLRLSDWRIGTAPEETTLREVSEDLMTRYSTLDSIVQKVIDEHEKVNPPSGGVTMLKDGEEVELERDNEEVKRKLMKDPVSGRILKLSDENKKRLDEIAATANHSISYSDVLDGNIKKSKSAAARAIPNLARLPEARLEMLEKLVPVQLVQIIRTTDDPEIAAACIETIGNLLEHNAEDVEYHKKLRAQIKVPFDKQSFTDEDVENFSNARTTLTKWHQTGWQVRLGEMATVGVFGYFYARARWGFFLKYIQKLEDKKLRKKIGRFRSPHGALMSIFMMYPVEHLISHHNFEKNSMKQTIMRYVNEFITFNVFVFAILVAPYCIIPSIFGPGIAMLFFPNTDNYIDDVHHYPHLFRREPKKIEGQPEGEKVHSKH